MRDMLNKTLTGERVQTGVPKKHFVDELERLSHHLRKVEQKIAIKTDYHILNDYHRLENEIMYTSHSIRKIKLKWKSQHPSELQTKSSAIV